MLFDDLAAEDLVGADAAVVATLRGGEAAEREAQRAALLEEGVLLLDAEPRLLVGELLGHLDERGAGVAGVRGHVDVEDLAEHQHVAAAADRVRAGEHRLEHAVGGGAVGLVGAGSVETPDREFGAVGQDPGLRTELGGRLGAVDPDVFSLEGHRRSP